MLCMFQNINRQLQGKLCFGKMVTKSWNSEISPKLHETAWQSNVSGSNKQKTHTGSTFISRNISFGLFWPWKFDRLVNHTLKRKWLGGDCAKSQFCALIIENENAMYADKLCSEDIRQTWKPNLNSSRFSSVGKRRRRVCISSARYWESFPNRKKYIPPSLCSQSMRSVCSSEMARIWQKLGFTDLSTRWRG